MLHRPVLRADLDPGQPGGVAFTISPLSAEQRAAVDQKLQTGGSLLDVLNVKVLDHGTPHDDTLPPVAGRYLLFKDSLRFVPHFPPEPGVGYRATFHPEVLGDPTAPEPITLQFSLPEPSLLSPAAVQEIYPTADHLPENLLRFYVVFSKPMGRGCAEQQVQLLGPDGEPAPDVLYRSPVELWDRSMRTLTILLDPGRLKRGVGPHRELGPPLASGRCYTLVIGAGMLDATGRPLAGPREKHFRVSAPMRDTITVGEWRILPPAAHTREALVLRFPAPLDWALLTTAITVIGQGDGGHVAIDEAETRWRLTPPTPWAAGSYKVLVHWHLEDVCGNSTLAAFDRPLRQGSNFRHEEVIKQLHFTVA